MSSFKVVFTIEHGWNPEYPYDVWEEYEGTRTLINSYNDIQAIYYDFPKAINKLGLTIRLNELFNLWKLLINLN